MRREATFQRTEFVLKRSHRNEETNGVKKNLVKILVKIYLLQSGTDHLVKFITRELPDLTVFNLTRLFGT